MPTWNGELAIGVPGIDEEHCELFRRADLLLAAMRQRRSLLEVRPLLEFLETYCVRHFQREERLMDETGYPGVVEQRAAHQQVKARLQAIADWCEAKGVSPSVVLETQELAAGIVQHIRVLDTKLAGYLNARQRAADRQGVGGLRRETAPRRGGGPSAG